MIHRRSSIEVPQDVDWATRFSPGVAAYGEGYPLASGAYFRRVHQIARENGQFMRQKIARQNGVIIGYHGTTTPNALSIMNTGFQNTWNEEDNYGVSAWDEAAGLEALTYAADRSKKAGYADKGKVIKVQMVDPVHDSKYGRLEWLGDAANIIPLELLTPEAMAERFGRPALANVSLDLTSVS